MAKKVVQLKTRADILLQQTQSPLPEPLYCGHIDNKGIYDPQTIKAFYPTDPETNLPMTDLGRLSDPYLSLPEKEKLMSRLRQEQGTFLPFGLSDEEIYSIIPPRYFTYDAVDVQAWRDYLSTDVLPNMSSVDTDDLQNADLNVQPSNNNEE